MTPNELKGNPSHRKFGFWLNVLLIGVVLLHISFFLAYWILNTSLTRSTNDYITKLVKLNIPYVTILLILVGLLGVWAIIRLIYLMFQVKKDTVKLRLISWSFIIVSIIFFAIFYGSLMTVFKLDASQKGVMSQFLDLIRIITDGLLLILVTLLLRSGFKKVLIWKSLPGAIPVIAIILGGLIFVAAWSIPLFFQPGWVYKGDLANKPKIMAHRGASMIAPENTLVAAETAAKMGAYGFESDLRISLDGVPFIMHDETLKRTTNIIEVFPGKENDLAENFLLTELKKLNAGWWFILQDPYETIKQGKIEQSQLSVYQAQKIPTLVDVLSAINKNGQILMYDLRLPAISHPHFNDAFEIVFDILKEAKAEDRVWLILEPDQVARVRQETPGITRVIGISSEDLLPAKEILSKGYQVVNVDKGISSEAIKEYQQADLQVNIYVIDEPWLFSQLWVKGVNSITSNSIHELKDLKAPVVRMSQVQFVIFWSLLGIILGLLIFSVIRKTGRDQSEQPISETEPVTVPAPIEQVIDEPIITPNDPSLPTSVDITQQEKPNDVEKLNNESVTL
jgi:glycerophosphoryl diester phosphodiesterase/heme/copper-type cytochrome/quinol oxidase subunit 3